MLNSLRDKAKKAGHWITQRKHVEKLRAAQAVFTRHPHETGESYLVHMWFTTKMGAQFAYVSSVIILHGIFPFLFTRTASIHVEKLYRVMKSRIPKKRLEEIDRERLMTRKKHENIMGEARIAIVGGGFCGSLVLANIVKRATLPMTIEWFDNGASLGLGLAYGTKLNQHLLNVQANKMGAFAGQPEGFYQWLRTAKGITRTARVWPGQDFEKESFLPRLLFAEYLKHIVDEALLQAEGKNILVNVHPATVRDAVLTNPDAQQITLTAEEKGEMKEILVDAMVLATGNLPPRRFNFLAGIIASKNYIADVWAVAETPEFKKRLSMLSDRSEIVILGSGLTMIDTLLLLTAKGYTGKVTVISRGGLLPTVHKKCNEYPKWLWVVDPRQAPLTAHGLLRGLRAEIKRAAQSGYDWRAVVDSLRPVTQTLWKRLSVLERRRFLKRLSTLWSIHRHRMAPEISAQVEAMQKSGMLKTIPGIVYHVAVEREELSFSYRRRGSNVVETLNPALVLNCTGPESDIASSEHSLLKNLRDRDLITVGPLRVGVEVTSNGSAKGGAPDTLYPVGPLLAGEYLECTSVPELRDVASQTADHVLNRVELIAHRDVSERTPLGEGI